MQDNYKAKGKNSKGGKPAQDNKPVRKLTTVSVVDRGTLDRDGETVAWTISKVLVVDLESRKTLSTSYTLKNGEAETTHTSLGEARTVVGKTIRHPEPVSKVVAASTGKGGKR